MPETGHTDHDAQDTGAGSAASGLPFDTHRRSFALALVLVNLCAYAVFAVLSPRSAGGDLHPASLLFAGAKMSELVMSGQWWRLFASVFLHADLAHLLVNCAGAYFLAAMAQGAFGWAAALVIYVISGAGGALLSVLLSPDPSVGASGAIYGLLGAISAYAVILRRMLPRTLQKALVGGTVLWVGVSVALAFNTSRIDSLSHLGGALAGVGLGAAFARLGGVPRRAFTVAAIACILVVAVSAGMSIRGMTLDFEIEPPRMSRLAFDGVSLPVPATWPRGRLSGTCKLDDTVPAEEIVTSGTVCFRDPFGTVLLVGPAGVLAQGMVLDPALTFEAGLRTPLSTRSGDVTRRLMLLDRKRAVSLLSYTAIVRKYDDMLSEMFDGVRFEDAGRAPQERPIP